MQPRYFIGISLPQSLSDAISTAQHSNVTSSKLMQPIKPHITLLDPNTLMKVSPMYLLPKIKKITNVSLPINVELQKLDGFDDRVIFISVYSPELIKLQEQLANLLPDDIRASYMVGRGFTPHVTLAQAKPRQKLNGDIRQAFEHKIENLLPVKFKVSELTKFNWQAPRSYKDVKI